MFNYGGSTLFTLRLAEFAKEEEMKRKLYFIILIACILKDQNWNVINLFPTSTVVGLMSKEIKALFDVPEREHYWAISPLTYTELIEPITIGLLCVLRSEGKGTL